MNPKMNRHIGRNWIKSQSWWKFFDIPVSEIYSKKMKLTVIKLEIANIYEN